MWKVKNSKGLLWGTNWRLQGSTIHRQVFFHFLHEEKHRARKRQIALKLSDEVQVSCRYFIWTYFQLGIYSVLTSMSRNCGLLCVSPTVWQQQSPSSGGLSSAEQCPSLPRDGHWCWVLQSSLFNLPFVWVGKHDCFPPVTAAGAFHPKSTAAGTLLMHHACAGKTLHFSSLTFFFPFFPLLKIVLNFYSICALLMSQASY